MVNVPNLKLWKVSKASSLVRSPLAWFPMETFSLNKGVMFGMFGTLPQSTKFWILLQHSHKWCWYVWRAEKTKTVQSFLPGDVGLLKVVWVWACLPTILRPLLNYIILFKPKVVYISYLHQIWESRSKIQNVVDWRTSYSISELMTFTLTCFVI